MKKSARNIMKSNTKKIAKSNVPTSVASWVDNSEPRTLKSRIREVQNRIDYFNKIEDLENVHKFTLLLEDLQNSGEIPDYGGETRGSVQLLEEGYCAGFDEEQRYCGWKDANDSEILEAIKSVSDAREKIRCEETGERFSPSTTTNADGILQEKLQGVHFFSNNSGELRSVKKTSPLPIPRDIWREFGLELSVDGQFSIEKTNGIIPIKQLLKALRVPMLSGLVFASDGTGKPSLAKPPKANQIGDRKLPKMDWSTEYWTGAQVVNLPIPAGVYLKSSELLVSTITKLAELGIEQSVEIAESLHEYHCQFECEKIAQTDAKTAETILAVIGVLSELWTNRPKNKNQDLTSWDIELARTVSDDWKPKSNNFGKETAE